MKRHDYTDDIQAVFDHWNSYRGRYKWLSRGRDEIGKWKGSKGLMPHHKREIRNYLKEGYTLDNIKEAIDNYALILLDKRYNWTKAWTLYELLTRHIPWQRETKQFYRFVGDFHHLDYMNKWDRRQLANPPIQPQVKELCKKVGKEIPALPKSRCAQRKDIDRLRNREIIENRLAARKKQRQIEQDKSER